MIRFFIPKLIFLLTTLHKMKNNIKYYTYIVIPRLQRNGTRIKFAFVLEEGKVRHSLHQQINCLLTCTIIFLPFSPKTTRVAPHEKSSILQNEYKGKKKENAGIAKI